MAEYDVAVLGGGPVGLFAALRLAREGRRVVVLERAPQVGGLAASFEIAGVRVDHGSHRLHPATPPAGLRVVQELLGTDLQRRVRHGRIAMAGRLLAFPPRATDLARRLPPRLALRLASDTARASLRPSANGDGSFGDAVRARFGVTMLREFYGPYATKLFGAPPDELDGELARRRIGARSGVDVVRRRRGRAAPDRRAFFYPRRGFGQIVDALAAAATEAGACIRTATAVTGLRPSASHVDCILDDGSAVQAANAWTSLPVPVLTTIANAPEAVRAAANALDHRSLVLCYLVVARPQWTDFDAHYFPGLDVIASRVSEPKNYRSNPDDPRDVTVLCAEIPCRRDDASWNASAETLAARLVDDLVGAGLPAPPVVDVAVRRVERAYPVYRRGYGAAFSVVDDWARGLPHVLTFGRHGLFAHDNTHHAFVMADAAVEALRDDGTVDAHAWSDARDRFRQHVVED